MSNEKLPYDIIFLKRRLNVVVEKEEYEKAAIIKRWIDELMVFYKVGEKSNKISKQFLYICGMDKPLNKPKCQCLYEIENGMPRTKFCVTPCIGQKEMLRDKNQPIEKIIEDLEISIKDNRYNKDVVQVLSGTLSVAKNLKK